MEGILRFRSPVDGRDWSGWIAAFPNRTTSKHRDGATGPLWVDAVEKVHDMPPTRNNRIIRANFLNQSCTLDARLESMSLEDPVVLMEEAVHSIRGRLALRAFRLDLMLKNLFQKSPSALTCLANEEICCCRIVDNTAAIHE